MDDGGGITSATMKKRAMSTASTGSSLIENEKRIEEDVDVCPPARNTERDEHFNFGFNIQCLECNSSCDDCLLHVENVPDYQKSEYIFSGYRPVLPIWRAAKTIFTLHNETGNIWTHLPPMLYVAWYSFNWLVSEGLEATWASLFFMVSFFSSLVAVYGSSAVYHILVCGVKPTAERCLCADMGSIAVHIVFAFLCTTHVGLWCHPGLHAFYMFLASGISLVMVVQLFLDGGKAEFRSQLCMAIAVAVGIVAALYIILFLPQPEAERFFFVILSGFVYIIGGVFWFTKWPEKWWPGKCDYFIQSHQIWHVCVACSGVMYLHGMCSLYSFQQTMACDARGDLGGYALDTSFNDILSNFLTSALATVLNTHLLYPTWYN